jgi:hypothetical protein
MPPRAILDVKLEGSGSELTNSYGELCMFGGGERLLRDPRVNQSSKSIDLATANFHNNAVSFRALKHSVIWYRSSHARIRDMKVYCHANIELHTAWLRVCIGRKNLV